MTKPDSRSPDPVTDPINDPTFADAADGDAFNDPTYRKLLGRATAAPQPARTVPGAKFMATAQEPALYAVALDTEALVYGLVAAVHVWCDVDTFCRNPLHPGPCKGWKHTLKQVAPEIHRRIEETRLEQVRVRREKVATVPKVPKARSKAAGKAPLVKLRPETIAHVKEVSASLPKTQDEWASMWRKPKPGKFERMIDYRVGQLQQDLDKQDALLEQGKQRVAEAKAKGVEWAKSRNYKPGTKQWNDTLSSWTHMHEQFMKNSEQVRQSKLDELDQAKRWQADPELLRRENSSTNADNLLNRLPVEYEYTFPRDGNDIVVPPAALKAHHERVQSAGRMLGVDLADAVAKDPELTRLRAEYATHENTSLVGKTYTERDMAWLERRRVTYEIRRRQREMTLDALSQVRAMGGASHTKARAPEAHELPSRIVGDKQVARADWREQLAVGEQHFPKDWIVTSDTRPLDIISSDRAYHVDAGFTSGATTLAMNTEKGKPTGYTGGFQTAVQEITVHEMGHRMEDMIPGLKALEFAYVRSKTTNKKGVVEKQAKLRDVSGGGYADSEVAYPDDFTNAYTGKTYERFKEPNPAERPWEVFQVGLQQVYGQDTLFGDTTLNDFVLGTLATLHQGG